MRSIKVGIDYGTSASKIVFWDDLSAGKAKAFVVEKDRSIRISSSVGFLDEQLVFGYSPDDSPLPARTVWYESVKMRVAAEVTASYQQFCYGGTPMPPQGLSFVDMATLTVWFLQSEATLAISKHLQIPIDAFVLDVKVGIPRHFYEDPALNKTFLSIAMAARNLQKTRMFPAPQQLSLQQAREILASVPKLDVTQHDPKDWIRSEAEAAMFWPVRSPEISAGPYAEIDIGAGTTNASIVCIWPQKEGNRWLKTNLGFYGAFSCSTGMDAIDLRIAQLRGSPLGESLAYRGRERECLRSVSLHQMDSVYSEIQQAYRYAWMRANKRINNAERITFPNHDLFVAGGGSTIPGLLEFLAHDADRKRKIRTLEPPSDLFYLSGEPVKGRDVAFLLPAYGLSFSRYEVPGEFDCEEFVPEPQKARGMAGMYEK